LLYPEKRIGKSVTASCPMCAGGEFESEREREMGRKEELEIEREKEIEREGGIERVRELGKREKE
jgi:hypothetical protein